MDFSKTCRICLKSSENLISIYDTTLSSDEHFSILWQFCFGEEIIIREGFPESICEECAFQLVEFCSFKKKYEQSTTYLASFFKESYKDVPVDLETSALLNEGDLVSCSKIDHDYTNKTKGSEGIGTSEVLEINPVKLEDNSEDVDGKVAINSPQFSNESEIFVTIKSYLLSLKKETNVEFHCKWCDNHFLVYEEFYRHIYSHCINECNYCYNPDKLQPERCMHENVTEHNCQRCNEYFYNYLEYDNHIKNHLYLICEHEITTDHCVTCLEQVLRFAEAGDNHIMCFICGDLVPNNCFKKHAYTIHELCEHLKDSEKCIYCIKESNKSKMRHKCNICAQAFTSKFYLAHHLLKHQNEKKYVCDYCGAAFLLPTYLKDHMEVHIPGEYTCDVCGKIFTRKSKFKRHKYTHFEKRHFFCNICGKGFKQKPHLKTHMVVHNEKKSHICSVCSRQFSLKGTLLRHMLLLHKKEFNKSD